MAYTGAESSGMDAAVPTIYHLAAAQGDAIDAMLADSVVLITAIFNPDGHAKRVAWFDAFGGQRAISDPQHIEHGFNWQFARTNHYWFDLNRQWLLVTQPEPRAWMRKWHEWRPNLTIDYHEMGSDSTYYFHPGVATRTNPLVPDEAERLMAEVVAPSEEFLDSEGRLYYHGEDFDNYYIGKGSTFPLINGGVGILYEAAAALGRELDTDNGLRTYRENIRKHFRTSIGSIEGALRLRDEFLAYQKSFYDSALEEARRYDTKAYVFTADGDDARTHHFIDLLNYHRIDVFALNRNLNVNGEAYTAGNAYVVPLNQPQFRLIRSLFETVDEFEDATFYDVSTWTMPIAFGLRYSALSGRNFRGDVTGDRGAPAMPSAAAPQESGVGYVIDWSNYYAPKSVYRALESGLLAKVATKPFTASTARGDVAFARGSILIPLDRQTRSNAQILALVRSIAEEDGVTAYALTSNRSVTGTRGVDIGGPSFKPLERPRTLLVMGYGMDLYEAGEVWHLLDYRMDMPVSMRERERLIDVDFREYTHIVFPGGEYEEYDAPYADRLRLWVQEGGTLIGLTESVPWMRATVLDYVDPLELADQALTEPATFEHEELLDDETERLNYEDKADREAEDVIGGAIFSADLDISHPISFGYSRRNIHLHKNTNASMERTDNPYATVAAYNIAPVVSGYTSAALEDELGGTAAIIAERVGNGSVILFADNPNFRGYWYGTNKLFLNALFFSRAFDPPVEE